MNEKEKGDALAMMRTYFSFSSASPFFVASRRLFL
jgi:hypothetical protein